MINLVVALQCEAVPFVNHFRLQKQTRLNGFSLYFGIELRLIVTGIGKSAIRAGCEYLHAAGGFPVQAWLNVGIAGHRDLAVGTGVCALRIIDQASGHVWRTSPSVPIPGIGKTVCTLEEPDPDYPGDLVYDMEASAYYAVAARFSADPLVQCYKVISDNRISGHEGIDPPMVVALLEQHISPVSAAVAALANLIDSVRDAQSKKGNSESLRLRPQ